MDKQLMKNKLAAAIIVALGATSASALAADTRINGFASINAGVMMDEDTSLFGYSDTISFKPESLFALQIASDLGDGLSATAQIMSRGKNDYAAEFEWAYVSYEISDSTQINAGKLRIPFYRYSDFLDVGYAYTWARPPQTVYNLAFSTFDGLSIVNNHTIGDWDSTVQAVYGSYDGSVDLVSDYDPASLENIFGVNWTLSYDWFTARAVYMFADTSISFENEPFVDVDDGTDTGTLVKTQALNKAFDDFGALLPEAKDNLEVKDDFGSFFGIGFSVDYNNILIDAEFTKVEVEDSIVTTQEQHYVSVGYRFDSVTVYAITEHGEKTNDDSYVSELPSLYQAGYAGLLATQNEETDGLTVGLRYNFHPSAALKVDYTTYDTLAFDSDIGTFESVESSALTVGVSLVF
jgi:hypothetical protein